MIPVVDSTERERILQLVRKYLEPHQPSNYRLEVAPEGLLQEDDWIYVVVEPDREGVPAYDYVARMVEAELDLQENERVNILLTPALVRD